MLKIRDYVLIAGVIISTGGMVCLPVGQEANPKRALSAFDQIADYGLFLGLSGRLILIGLTVVIAAVIIPRITDRLQRYKRYHLAGRQHNKHIIS